MPKRKGKGKSTHIKRVYSDSEDDTISDTVSILSGATGNDELRVNEDDLEEVQEIAKLQEFEDKVCEALDGVNQKSSLGRTKCYEAVCKALMKKYVPDFISNRKMTICDAIERGLHKGNGAELVAAIALGPLLCIQLGHGEESEEVCSTLMPILQLIVNDPTTQPMERAKACSALALMTFLSGGEMNNVMASMNCFANIFGGSYLKNDGSVPNVSPDIGLLHASALSAWGLLSTVLAPSDLSSLMSNGNSFSPSIDQLAELLHSPHLELRLAAGEALALIYEVGREWDEDFGESHVDELIGDLRALATDSNKYRAKKDRKLQRATFRDVLSLIEDEEVDDELIRFREEELNLDTWCRRKLYEVLCNTLGSGMNTHLAENVFVRQIFQLDNKPVINRPAGKEPTKKQKSWAKQHAFKNRTKDMKRIRDKRCFNPL